MTELNKILDAVKTKPIIPVLTIYNLDHAVPLVDTFAKANINTLEITFRTELGALAIEKIKTERPEMIIGAGTVINEQDSQTAINCGSDFIVTPGITDNLLETLSQLSIPTIPGIASASEAMIALEKGFTHQKLFPASIIGGPDFLQAIYAPLPQISFMPSGGVSQKNAADYLSHNNVFCVCGTWMVDKEMVAQENWSELANYIKQHASL
jgi:2-dehydro-3-deoxyphosphogluconate aldolase/(4S)-4-hydroxy-2-oxoglutarate aldolase